MEVSEEWMYSAASPICPSNKSPCFELPKIDTRVEDGFCKCRPICKNRRRVWQGKVLETSTEKLHRLRPDPECIRRWRGHVAAGPCPVLGRPRRYEQQSRKGTAIRLCQASLDAHPDTPNLHFAQLLKKIGADAGLRNVCPFCECRGCCTCARGRRAREYAPRDPERARARNEDMRAFDKRVKERHGNLRAMYDIPVN